MGLLCSHLSHCPSIFAMLPGADETLMFCFNSLQRLLGAQASESTLRRHLLATDASVH